MGHAGASVSGLETLRFLTVLWQGDDQVIPHIAPLIHPLNLDRNCAPASVDSNQIPSGTAP